jgi:hypothetical protein
MEEEATQVEDLRASLVDWEAGGATEADSSEEARGEALEAGSVAVLEADLEVGLAAETVGELPVEAVA